MEALIIGLGCLAFIGLAILLLSEAAGQKQRPTSNPNSLIRTRYKNGRRISKKWNPNAPKYVSDEVPEQHLKRVAQVTHSRQTAEMLLLQAKANGKSWEWAVDKVLYDIQRGR